MDDSSSEENFSVFKVVSGKLVWELVFRCLEKFLDISKGFIFQMTSIITPTHPTSVSQCYIIML